MMTVFFLLSNHFDSERLLNSYRVHDAAFSLFQIPNCFLFYGIKSIL